MFNQKYGSDKKLTIERFLYRLRQQCDKDGHKVIMVRKCDGKPFGLFSMVKEADGSPPSETYKISENENEIEDFFKWEM